MDLIQSYNDEGVSSSPESSPPRILNAKSSAPELDYTELDLTAVNVKQPKSKTYNPTQQDVVFNHSYEHPYYGPSQEKWNHKLGFVEDAFTGSFVYNTFHKYGDMEAMKRRKIEKKKKKNKEEEKKKEIEPESENPAWLLENRKSPWSRKKEVVEQELTEEQKKYAEDHAKKKKEKEQQGRETKEEHHEDKSTFHGKEGKDYHGRSWIEPPEDAKANNDDCYIPKRCVHTWNGHEKGVSAIRFFPKQGHLLLSAGMDSKVKIWDVHNNSGKCMRTYMGHTKAVKDICFSNDGTNFLTAGYDNKIKFWDTETGQVISTFSTGKVAYVVKLNPDDDKQKVLLSGMRNKKIVQWDINTGKITQEYNQHLGAVNTITFVDDNRRFVTSSDDQSLRVWEFGIPVVIKSISEPHMHSMPSVSLHPNGNWIAAQSLDNQIVVYNSRKRFHVYEKKRFTGHLVAGYACQVNFSPDGRFVMSGDGKGKCWFWDWKSCKVLKTHKCHNGVCIGAEWHPLEQSKVATCGWDGLIKYWD